MGKASKWIRNLLMGKREDKGKKAGTSVPPETCTLAVISAVKETPKVTRRWSFKRSTSAKPTSHKTSRSFDSILLPKQALLPNPTQENNAHTAATKIQANYRSYLARRALRALKGLVKLQALARGHLVRKQMNTVARSMHAVMAIQVRARIHRIQMAEEPPAAVERRKFCRESSASDRQFIQEISENRADGNSRGFRSRSGHIPAERVENGRRLSVSQREYQPKMYPSPSTLSFTDSSSTTYDGQLEEFSFKMARRNPSQYSACPENKNPFILPPSECPAYIPSHSHFIPNYMTNTKSSKAKARSNSEPRQRPELGTKQKSRRSSSMDGKNDKQNQYPWLIKLYSFEPPMNLY